MESIEQAAAVNVQNIGNKPAVMAYPNPFEGAVRFKIDVPEKAQYTLMLYTASGKLIGKVFDGEIEAQGSRSVEYNVPSIYTGAIVYVLSYNGQVITGKIVRK